MSSDDLPEDFFYKLRCFNLSIPHQEEQIFVESKLHFANPVDFNDPFECKPHFRWVRDGRYERHEIRGMIGRNMAGASRNQRRAVEADLMAKLASDKARKEYKEQLEERLRQLYMRASICSFTKSPLHIPSWSYYADAHRGYCLGFDFTIGPWELPGSPVVLIPFDVEYAEEYPVVTPDRARLGVPDWESIVPHS